MSKSSLGRIVMLVDNDVENDSRVQKQARAASEQGWEVHLLGQRRFGVRSRWKIHDAEVRLIKYKEHLINRRHLLRRAFLRAPLAYNRPVMARLRKQMVKARVRDLETRRNILFLQDRAEGRTIASALEAATIRVRRTWLKVEGRWVGFRAQRTINLEKRRLEATSPIDRFWTAYWKRTKGVRAWRKLDPSLWDWELAYGPVIDGLKPDIIHANDFRMLGVGARATIRARAAGGNPLLVWDAHEFLPGIKPWNLHPRWHTAQILHEREFAPCADLVMTVSEDLGELLVAEHGLKETPTVVMNAPDLSEIEANESLVDIRTLCGLEMDQPLLVYCGAAAPQRGLDIMVEGLKRMLETHVALVVPNAISDYVQALIERAHQIDATERLHILPYVPIASIVPFLATADIGVHPPHHWPNHEISLGTKFFEYSHARLPIVVSDVKAMSEMVLRTGQGTVFTAENLDSYVAAIEAVLADPERYRAAYDKPGLLESWTWDTQAEILVETYRKLIDSKAP